MNNQTRKQVSSLDDIQKLYETAKELIAMRTAGAQEITNAQRQNLLDEMATVLARIEASADESDELEHIRSAAQEIYGYHHDANDIELDPHGTYHNGTNGYWVGAYLWVSEENANEGDSGDDDDDDEDD